MEPRRVKINIFKPKDRVVSFEEVLTLNEPNEEERQKIREALRNEEEKYEFIVEVRRNGIARAKENLQKYKELPYGFKTKDTDVHDIYKTLEYAKIEIDVDTKKGTVIEGVYTCGNCGFKKVSMVTKQLRRADEPETNLFTCLRCFSTWRVG
jgi:DNA-directed RNA polymerase subunit M/transcription elongation factor TFIIS